MNLSKTKLRISICLVIMIIPQLLFATPPQILRVDLPFKGSKLFVIDDGKPHPGIILLHGSEGGSVHSLYPDATMLAAQGYSALAFCYFDCERPFGGLRETLKESDLYKAYEAFRWLKESIYVKNKKVAIYGFSRGAEATLILGEKIASTPASTQPDALIAHSPSDFYNGTWNWDWKDPRCWICKKGLCNEHMPRIFFSWNPSCGPEPDSTPESHSAWLWNKEPLPLKKRIEIERFKGPILLTVGTKDTVWPPDQTTRIENTLKKAGKKPEVHYFDGEDHQFNTVNENLRQAIVLKFLEHNLN